MSKTSKPPRRRASGKPPTRHPKSPLSIIQHPASLSPSTNPPLQHSPTPSLRSSPGLSSGFTHSANGVTGDASTGYGDTGFSPRTPAAPWSPPSRDNVTDGTIVEVPSRSQVQHEPFSALNPDGPWDDVLGYGFRCKTCGQLCYLSAETYHGSGGEWRPVARI